MKIRSFLLIASAAAIAFSVPAGAQTKPATEVVKVKKKKTVKVKAETKAEKVVVEKPTLKSTPVLFGIFNAEKPKLEPLTEEQIQNDEKYAVISEKKKVKIDRKFVPQTVSFKGYKPGTIVIDTKEKFLYFIDSPVSAFRYGVAVGKEGLLFTGKATVGSKQAWPRWIPTKEMIARDPGRYKRYSDGMDGGPENPLGARAIYLFQGKQDTYLRIHGTNQPNSIGTASSNGCFRMINEHVMDLYDRVKMGAEVVVL
ncbi:MAG: L,D-transpeptidase [Rhizobiaceae bacterium]